MTRLPSRLPQRGPVKVRWESHHRRSRTTVMARCRGVCEGCGATGVPLVWAHIFSRRAIVGEPLCSTPELTAALCTSRPGILGCHEAIDRHLDPDLRDRLEREAVERLTGVWPEGEPADVVRAWEREHA